MVNINRSANAEKSRWFRAGMCSTIVTRFPSLDVPSYWSRGPVSLFKRLYWAPKTENLCQQQSECWHSNCSLSQAWPCAVNDEVMSSPINSDRMVEHMFAQNQRDFSASADLLLFTISRPG